MSYTLISDNQSEEALEFKPVAIKSTQNDKESLAGETAMIYRAT
jgi:hypothetical protein